MRALRDRNQGISQAVEPLPGTTGPRRPPGWSPYRSAANVCPSPGRSGAASLLPG